MLVEAPINYSYAALFEREKIGALARAAVCAVWCVCVRTHMYREQPNISTSRQRSLLFETGAEQCLLFKILVICSCLYLSKRSDFR